MCIHPYAQHGDSPDFLNALNAVAPVPQPFTVDEGAAIHPTFTEARGDAAGLVCSEMLKRRELQGKVSA